MKRKVAAAIIILCIMYILTCGMIALLSFIMWKRGVGLDYLSVLITAVYIFSNFAGGFLMGGKMGKYKYLWGLAISMLYVGILFLAGILVNGEIAFDTIHMFNIVMICGISGTLGGMLSPGKAKKM